MSLTRTDHTLTIVRNRRLPLWRVAAYAFVAIIFGAFLSQLVRLGLEDQEVTNPFFLLVVGLIAPILAYLVIKTLGNLQSGLRGNRLIFDKAEETLCTRPGHLLARFADIAELVVESRWQGQDEGSRDSASYTLVALLRSGKRIEIDAAAGNFDDSGRNTSGDQIEDEAIAVASFIGVSYRSAPGAYQPFFD